VTGHLTRLVTGGIDARLAGATLTVDLDALAENYSALSRVCQPAHTAAVVKADAYGLGLDHVVPALLRAGCETFFVAFPDEGARLRRLAPDARIFVLAGLFGHAAERAYMDDALIPVLNSPREAAMWESFGGTAGRTLPCAVNVDTGMNRLGMTPSEARSLADENALTRALEIVLVMSHLACADEPAHPMNGRQAEAFARVRANFEGTASSLANSAGILLGRDHHLDLVRPGIALYGGAPTAAASNPMRTVVTAEARVAQIRHAKAGETVSYGATVTLQRDTVIAVVSAGYADGYHRAGSGRAHGFVAGRRVPVLGRVTMDATMFDVTDLAPGAIKVGDMIELFGRHLTLDEAATAAGTISYEMLTGIGRRYHRVYVGGQEG
jgi:alanine racemase